MSLYNKNRIDLLEEIAKKYLSFDEDSSEENLKPLLQSVIGF